MDKHKSVAMATIDNTTENTTHTICVHIVALEPCDRVIVCKNCKQPIHSVESGIALKIVTNFFVQFHSTECGIVVRQVIDCKLFSIRIV